MTTAALTPCCSLARRHDFAEIDAELSNGAIGALSAVARRTGLSKSVLSKHVNECQNGARTAQERRKNGARTAQEREPMGPARPLLASAQQLYRRASRLLRKLEGADDIDFKSASGLLNSIKGALELQAKLLGEIKAASTTITVYSSPEWHHLRDLLLHALVDHPAALESVIAVLAAEEQRVVH